jgi:hypothetical protein
MELLLTAKNSSSNRVLTLNELFSFKIEDNLITQNVKNIALSPNQTHSSVQQEADMIVMNSDLPVTFKVDTIEMGHGKFFIIHKTNGIQSYSIENTPQNGFVNLNHSVLTYNYNTRTVTLNPTGSSYTVLFNGETHTISTGSSQTHGSTEGVYYFWIDENMDFNYGSELPTSNIIPYCCIAYYNDINNSFYSDERSQSVAVTNVANVKILLLK